jgi:hypothetical protein
MQLSIATYFGIPNKSETEFELLRMWWTEHVARMGEGRGVYRAWIGSSEGKRSLGRPRRRW